MLVVRLGPGDVEWVAELMAAISGGRNDVLVGIDEQGLKVRDGIRWSAPTGQVQP